MICWYVYNLLILGNIVTVPIIFNTQLNTLNTKLGTILNVAQTFKLKNPNKC